MILHCVKQAVLVRIQQTTATQRSASPYVKLKIIISASANSHEDNFNSGNITSSNAGAIAIMPRASIKQPE
jgi:hypothetical protein